MIVWEVKFRGDQGVDRVQVEADTREDAEDVFHLFLKDEDMFGSILRIEPLAGMC